MEDCASDKGRAASHPPVSKELADHTPSPAACGMMPPGSASPSEEGLLLTQSARPSFSSLFGFGWQQMFLSPSVQMLGCWLWSAVCFLFCHSHFEPTDSALLLQEYQVPSTEFKPKGNVSEERSLLPRQMHNLNSNCIGILFTNELPLPAQGFATAMDPTCTAGRGMDACSVVKTCWCQCCSQQCSSTCQGKKGLQTGIGLLLLPVFVSPSGSCGAVLHSEITLPCQQALLGLLFLFLKTSLDPAFCESLQCI